MKATLRPNRLLLPTAKLHARETLHPVTSRNVSSTASASSSRASALAKAAEASATASERLAAGGAPILGPSYTLRQDANKLDSSTHRIFSDHDEAHAYLNLSSSQARRSRAARFGTNRHTTYASPTAAVHESSRYAAAAEEQDEDEQLALAYASPTGTSTSSIYLPEYVAWAISQLIAAANDPKLLRADHLKLAHLTDPQEHMAEAAHIPPKRSSLLHLATVSPHRYAAILAVLAEVRQRLSTPVFAQGSDAEVMEKALPRWAPDTVLDFDCAAGEGLWAAAQVFRQDEADPRSSTSVQRYHGYDRRPNLLKSGKKVAQSSSSNVSPADPVKPSREVKLKDEGEQIEVDGITYYEQDSSDVDLALEETAEEEEGETDQPVAHEYFSGPKSAMSSVEKTFQSVPLAKDLTSLSQNGRTLALSAFALSLMTNDTNRFEAVKAMWDSGADVIVIIDQATPRGFASVASARAQLLQLGKQHASAQGGGAAHVVAPCSHDKPCPLLHPFAIGSAAAAAVGARSDTGNPAKSKDVCGFTARYHTPTFLRRTKHSDRGEENVGYSYVVVRRGARPSLVGEARRRLAVGEQRGDADADEVAAVVQQLAGEASTTKTGILDLLRNAKKASVERRMLQEVDANAALTAGVEAAPNAEVGEGKEEMSDQQAMDELLKLLPDAVRAEFTQGSTAGSNNAQMTPEQLDAIMASVRTSLSPPTPSSAASSSSSTSADVSDERDANADADAHTISVAAPTVESELAMRLESYAWPRLIKAPLKKGGHVTLDACCASGNIERFTISKASGKQAYQDARKSKWGDLFPHPSRSKSVIKVLNPVFAVEMQEQEQGGTEREGNVMDQLVLRAPSKLNNHGAGGKKGWSVVGSGEEDEESILRELFEDLPDDHASAGATGSRWDHIDKGQAAYKLISPNLVTPTKKQTKRLAINYNNKWLGPAATAKPNQRVQRSTPPTVINSEDHQARFESSLDKGVQHRRSSRKKSRGDWDTELFG
ncbi:hypothetical protein EX895_001021 [Sporisorium graminicola]|uniref:Rsm22-domain-containing protein n=1 Tax=Sporisorium graminicola TaxID=280036 RepID=A0A4U7L649_9BASI|nr:hypothetical protein EX895_001021 [Sporisorium graminicola]TKY91022.1 hypothetical protein EX895_001021 [Sporisorium graminicola]